MHLGSSIRLLHLLRLFPASACFQASVRVRCLWQTIGPRERTLGPSTGHRELARPGRIRLGSHRSPTRIESFPRGRSRRTMDRGRMS